MRMTGRMGGTALGAVSALLTVGLSGCGGPKPDGSAPTRDTGPAASRSVAPPAGVPGSGFKAALVLDTGGVDDKSFNAAAWAGLQRAKEQLGVSGRYVESKVEADYKTNLTQFANQGYDLVFAVGYKMEEALKEVAPQFPNVKFAIVDGNAPPDPNCAALQFKEQEGAFLAGYLAAAMSQTKKIGFVGGEKIP